MTDSMKEWLELVSADEELRKELMRLNEASRDEAVKRMIGIAAGRGIRLTEEDLSVHEDALSDDELEAVAGGGGCGCPVAGGGAGNSTSDSRQYGCGCVLVGSGAGHCFCTAVGGGADVPMGS